MRQPDDNRGVKQPQSVVRGASGPVARASATTTEEMPRMADVVEMENAGLPFRRAAFTTIVEGLDYAARGRTGCRFFSGRGQPEGSLTYRELGERAVDLAGRLAAEDFGRYARVAVIGETSPDFLTLFFACQYAGLIPVPLPFSVHLGGGEAYVARLQAMMRAAKASLAVGPAELLPILGRAAEPLAISVATVADLAGLSPADARPHPLQADEPCYVQYSSGSTREPRGVVVTQRSALHNARGIARDGLKLRPGDCGTSWLPLYHDMGLVGFCLTPMLCQIPIHYLSPTSFARRPLVWPRVIAEFGGTISFSPTSGYELCARAANSSRSLDLSHWRVAGVGGDMIRPDVLERFAQRFHPYGFSATAFVPSYGLAEATLAVSFGALNAGLRVDEVDLARLESAGYAAPARSRPNGSGAKVRAFARCGRPLPGHEVSIADAEGQSLPDRVVGRVRVRGPSVAAGCADDPLHRAGAGSDRWLDTGDLGYTIDGELVITGRSKDLIIWSGRNIWPEDLEWALGELDGIRTGAVAAFGVTRADGDGEVVVVAECRTIDPAAWPALRRAIVATVHRTAGVACRAILAAPRSLAFTSSGKMSRAATRALYLEGKMRDVASADRPPDDAALVGEHA